MKNAAFAAKPDHVPEALVRDFDFYAIPGSELDIQAAYQQVQREYPAIFWTPRNGGHWVATRAEDIVVMQKDYTRFSYRNVTLPPMPKGVPPQIPLELDPPVHAQYRRPLMQALTPSRVRELEQRVHDIAVQTIEDLVPRGECEFIEDFAKVLPINVFLSMVDLPLEDKGVLLPLAETSVRSPDGAERMEAQKQMGAYLYSHVARRREIPGDDLLSQLVNTHVDGVKIPIEEAVNYATLVLFGGLDTVAGMIGLVAKFLAEHPDKRREIAARLDDDAFLTRAIEELVRRHGIANTARVVTHDLEYNGIRFREGDRLLPPNLLVGVDESLNLNPLEVDFDREKGVHAAFGNGPHACPGAILARREMRIFLREWLSRIPDFRVAPGTTPRLVTGQVNGILELRLVWT